MNLVTFLDLTSKIDTSITKFIVGRLVQSFITITRFPVACLCRASQRCCSVKSVLSTLQERGLVSMRQVRRLPRSQIYGRKGLSYFIMQPDTILDQSNNNERHKVVYLFSEKEDFVKCMQKNSSLINVLVMSSEELNKNKLF